MWQLGLCDMSIVVGHRLHMYKVCDHMLDGCVHNWFHDVPEGCCCAAPIKLFGDLHGQFGDLMRLFEEYGTPSTAGDITYIDYLFLGDYVDRGAHSLETICLLLALKIEHPKNVHLIRGNHEVRLCLLCQTLSSHT